MVDLVGTDDKAELLQTQRLFEVEFDGISKNLEGIRSFYKRKAGSKVNVPDDKLLEILKEPMSNAVHLLLLTADITDKHTAETLRFVSNVKFNLDSILNIFFNRNRFARSLANNNIGQQRKCDNQKCRKMEAELEAAKRKIAELLALIPSNPGPSRKNCFAYIFKKCILDRQ